MGNVALTARAGAPGMRAELLRAADRCIQRHGIRKTTMDDIAREAGMSRPSLYRHFADREELLLALSTAHARALTTRTLAAIAAYGSFSERLVEGLLCLAEDGHRDELIRFLVSRDDAEVRSGRQATAAAAGLTADFWDAFLTSAGRASEMHAAGERREVHRWLGIVSALLMSLMDQGSARTRDEYRDLLHTFVVPGITCGPPPLPA